MTPIDILTTLPPIVAGFIGLLAPLCIAVILWAVLPRRAPGRTAWRDADIERQIATLRKGADHSVATRPRVRAISGLNGPATYPKPAAPLSPPKPCSGGLCRKRIDCADQHCPGKVEALLASHPVPCAIRAHWR